MTYRPRALSYSQIELYSRCPAAWERRYVHGVVDRTPAMAFGLCFAQALEALHGGADGETAWVRTYAALQAAGEFPPGSPTIEHGLTLLGLYRQRGVLTGQPEVRWSCRLPNQDAVPVPIVGVCDLVTEHEVVEIKTAVTKWDQGRCDNSLQGHLYAFAYRMLTGRKPRCVRWLCFHQRQPVLQEFESYPAAGELYLLELQAAAVWRGIRDGHFEPKCRQPWCQACVEAGVVRVPAQKSHLVLELGT